jgi:hypothetical protein
MTIEQRSEGRLIRRFVGFGFTFAAAASTILALVEKKSQYMQACSGATMERTSYLAFSVSALVLSFAACST